MTTRARWGIGVAAVVFLVLLFYGLRTERPHPNALPLPAPSAMAPNTAPQASRTISAEPAAGALKNDLSPKAAARAPAVPNFVDLVQAVKPAVVSIRVKADVTPQVTSGDGGANPFEGTPFERFFRQFGPRGQRQEEQFPQRHQYAEGQGSGFFISADGYVVTNNHVIANAVKLEVVKDDGKVLDAKIIGADPKTDLALLKVEGSGFSFVTLADEAPKIGEWVIAMGNPFGLGGTV